MRCLSHILRFFSSELYLAPRGRLSRRCRWKAAAAGPAEGQETQLPASLLGGWGDRAGAGARLVFLISNDKSDFFRILEQLQLTWLFI